MIRGSAIQFEKDLDAKIELQVKLQEEEIALKKRVTAARKKLEDSDLSGIENLR